MTLVSLQDFKDHLGIRGPEYDPQLTLLLAETVALFEAATGRSEAPFSAAISGRIETRDGTGTAELHLDYPIGSITEVVLGNDPADPAETLDTTDRNIVVFTAGDYRMTRVDGGTWGRTYDRDHIRVTYTTAADLPTVADVAIKRVGAQVWEQRGSEDATRETLGDGSSRQLANLTETDPIWALAVNQCRRIQFA